MTRSKKGSGGGGGRGNRGRGRGGFRKRAEIDTARELSAHHGASEAVLNTQGFSLLAVAQNTQLHESSRLSSMRLRDTRVNFVSADNLRPPSINDPEIDMECVCLEEFGSDREIGKVTDLSRETEDIQEAGSIEERHESTVEKAQNNFIIDTEGSHSIETGLPPPRIRSPSPTPSNSSEEIILFGGRDSDGKCIERLSLTAPKSSKSHPLISTIEDDVTMYSQDRQSNNARGGAVATKLIFSNNRNKARGTTSTDSVNSELRNRFADESGSIPLASRKNNSKSNRSRIIGNINNEMMDDYIANIREQGMDISEPYNERELGGLDNDIWQHSDSSAVSNQKTLDVESNNPDLAGFNILTAADEYSGSEDDELALTYKSGDSDDDNIDLVEREIDCMNDEKIARLLAKQVELGFNLSELALFDRNEVNGRRTPSRRRRQLQQRQKVSGAYKDEFPSAAMLADAYDGFDIMDFERPSLKKKAKGRKGKLPFDVSDPELEASMQSVWDNDRARKKQKKEDRELQRSLGLLGKNSNKPDLSIKYKEGMGIQAIKNEIRLFLTGNNTTLALPPMDKKDRVVVHEIANAFNLKSKSVGAERKRFPVLYRTQRTHAFNENIFNSVERRISRRFFPRMDIKGKTSANRTGPGFSSGPGGYRDGDVVGGSAPELGVENRGRAMLEKMGWSSGTALGAINNKGILQPVSHVVKTTKAGLG